MWPKVLGDLGEGESGPRQRQTSQLLHVQGSWRASLMWVHPCPVGFLWRVNGVSHPTSTPPNRFLIKTTNSSSQSCFGGWGLGRREGRLMKGLIRASLGSLPFLSLLPLSHPFGVAHGTSKGSCFRGFHGNVDQRHCNCVSTSFQIGLHPPKPVRFAEFV